MISILKSSSVSKADAAACNKAVPTSAAGTIVLLEIGTVALDDGGEASVLEDDRLGVVLVGH